MIEKILEKDNHKFMYSAIRDGVTKKLYAPTVEQLKASNVLFSIPRLVPDGAKTTGINTSYKTAGIDTSYDDFRLYYSDISLYERPYSLKITESAILQNIISTGMKTYYWESGTGAELSCVIEREGQYIPIDIHTNGKGKGRSISAFQKVCSTNKTIKLSEENCRFDGNTVNIPVYAAYGLKNL